MLQYDCNHKAGIKERSVASIRSDPVEGDAKAFVSLLLCQMGLTLQLKGSDPSVEDLL